MRRLLTRALRWKIGWLDSPGCRRSGSVPLTAVEVRSCSFYPWTVKPGREKQFEDGWRKLTVAIREVCGSYGSRLHRADDGIYYAYAMWPSEQARHDCGSADLDSAAGARRAMREAIDQDHPEIRMTLLIDEIRQPPRSPIEME